jgi:hypothetical protein
MKVEGKIVLVMALVLATPLVVTWCAHPTTAVSTPPPSPP